MEYIIIALVSFVGSALTLFSGFGLGTLLVPVFTLFFPVDLAIMLTAIVHFLNNLFKLILIGGKADWIIVIRFGIPSVIGAIIGAYILSILSYTYPLIQYKFYEKSFSVVPLKLVIAVLLMIFVFLEVIPYLKKLHFDKRYLILGGLLSGFFGGLSGNQGALRSAFLMRSNISKEAFIATGVVIACIIDISRMTMYAQQIAQHSFEIEYSIILTATLAAFFGAFMGIKLLKKITIQTIHIIVTILLFIFAFLLGLGIL